MTQDSSDGNALFADVCRKAGVDYIKLVADTARWVHPEIFGYLPVWYPEVARADLIYNAKWSKVCKNARRDAEKREANQRAAAALKVALDAKKSENWTCCHIWGEHANFTRENAVVKDARYYSCVANTVLVPTPLKALTDALPDVKAVLRAAAFHLYGWVCEHADASEEAKTVRSGELPKGYPGNWVPNVPLTSMPGIGPFTDRVRRAADKRVVTLMSCYLDRTCVFFPRERVKQVLTHWGIWDKIVERTARLVQRELETLQAEIIEAEGRS